jgi:hypothetical protein
VDEADGAALSVAVAVVEEEEDMGLRILQGVIAEVTGPEALAVVAAFPTSID